MQTVIQRNSSCRGLIYGIFQHPSLLSRKGGSVLALVAAHPLAGTTYLANLLIDTLNADMEASALVLDCRALGEEVTNNTKPPHRLEDQLDAALPDKVDASWLSSRDVRARYLSDFRERYNTVLLDFPSLKENTDILAFAPVVDGIILVIEANKTTKSQIGFLQQTIEDGGGKILGHILNKRNYPIPGWAHQALELWGM